MSRTGKWRSLILSRRRRACPELAEGVAFFAWPVACLPGTGFFVASLLKNDVGLPNLVYQPVHWARDRDLLTLTFLVARSLAGLWWNRSALHSPHFVWLRRHKLHSNRPSRRVALDWVPVPRHSCRISVLSLRLCPLLRFLLSTSLKTGCRPFGFAQGEFVLRLRHSGVVTIPLHSCQERPLPCLLYTPL